MNVKKVNVLIADDSPHDRFLITDAFKAIDNKIQLFTVSDGIEALDFLHKRGQHADAPFRPDLIILDVYMPNKGGLQVLKEIKGNPNLKNIPTIMLSSSVHEYDVNQAYGFSCNCYIIKPMNPNDYNTVIKSVVAFWLKTVELPTP